METRNLVIDSHGIETIGSSFSDVLSSPEHVPVPSARILATIAPPRTHVVAESPNDDGGVVVVVGDVLAPPTPESRGQKRRAEEADLDGGGKDSSSSSSAVEISPPTKKARAGATDVFDEDGNCLMCGERQNQVFTTGLTQALHCRGRVHRSLARKFSSGPTMDEKSIRKARTIAHQQAAARRRKYLREAADRVEADPPDEEEEEGPATSSEEGDADAAEIVVPVSGTD